jgi:short-subunit dehydrogenase
MEPLRGRVVLVTGASSGIGEGAAHALVQHGAKVALVARSAAKLEALARVLGGPEHAVSFPLDVTDRQALAQLPARVKGAFGRLDVLINNAGAHHRGPLRERTAAEIAQMVDTNLTAPLLLTHAALPHLEADGVIVNVASLAGKVPLPGAAAYSSTKFGLRTFGRALDFELQLEGRAVRVVNVSPGPVDTGFFGDDLDRVADLTFSQPLSDVGDVVDAIVRAIGRPEVGEIDVPAVSGVLSTLAYLSPRLYAALRPLMAKVGARNKARYGAELRARQSGRPRA